MVGLGAVSGKIVQVFMAPGGTGSQSLWGNLRNAAPALRKTSFGALSGGGHGGGGTTSSGRVDGEKPGLIGSQPVGVSASVTVNAPCGG